jgi:plasmid stabilization system protein ParE
VGGVEALGDRYGRTPWRRDTRSVHATHRDGHAASDCAEVARGIDVVFALVERQTLDATVELLRAPPRAHAPHRAFESSVQSVPIEPVAAVARIRAEQRAIACRIAHDERDLDAAFVLGVSRAETLLDEVGQLDAATIAWITAVKTAIAR